MPEPAQVQHITNDEAIAALRRAAWTEPIAEEKYVAAVEQVRRICAPAGAGRDRAVYARDILAAVDEALGTPRTLIHCLAGGFGADWDLDSAIALAERAEQAAWVPHLIAHDLTVKADGKVYCFEARWPARDATRATRPETRELRTRHAAQREQLAARHAAEREAFELDSG